MGTDVTFQTYDSLINMNISLGECLLFAGVQMGKP